MSQFSDKSYDANKYASVRPTYPDSLYQTIRDYIDLKEGEKVSIGVDIGCGPGEATGALAEQVANKMFGLDPSEVMLQAAKDKNSQLGDRVNWIVGDDTTLTAQTDSHSVDLVTVAEAAHWFSYPDFWESVHHVLKPNGVLAYWGYYDFYFVGYPESKRIIQEFGAKEDKCLPYWAPGQYLLRNLYRDLEPPSNLYKDIKVYRDDGSEQSQGKEQAFEMVKHDITVREALGILGTYSSYHTWKSENKGKPDILEETTKELLEKTGLTLDSKVTVKTNTVLVLARSK